MKKVLAMPRATVIGAALVIGALILIGTQIKDDSPTGGLQVTDTFAVEGPRPATGALIATDGDLPTDNLPLWWLNRGGRTLHELSPTGENGAVSELRRVPLAPLSHGQKLDVSTWGPLDAPAVFRMTPTGRGVDVTVTRPGSSDPIAEGTAVLPPPSPGATRDLAIATWMGDRPDLFVIDRGLDDQRVAIRVFSGESDFSEKVLDVRAPIAGLDPDEWSLDVANVSGPANRIDQRPDLVLFRRDGGSSGQPEVHVITGESDFQDFALQRVVALPEEIEAKSVFTTGASRGTPTIYGLEPGSDAKLRLILLEGAITPI
jgi:hypothetical protein